MTTTPTRTYWTAWAALAPLDELRYTREGFHEDARRARRGGNKGLADEYFGLVRLLDRELKERVRARKGATTTTNEGGFLDEEGTDDA
jgi:hypothetical protein